MAAGTPVWSSRFAFIMASVGFAVGLGNIWRFPYVTGENGGGAFVIIYLLCVFAIGVPCVMAELLVGRRGQSSPSKSMAAVAEESGHSRNWGGVGGLGVFTAYTISITYAVVVGWVLWYLIQAAMTGFSGVDAASSTQDFNALLADGSTMLIMTVVGNLIVGGIIYAGVTGGIERAVTVDDAFVVRTLGRPQYLQHVCRWFWRDTELAVHTGLQQDRRSGIVGRGGTSVLLHWCWHGWHDDLRILLTGQLLHYVGLNDDRAR